MPLLLTLVLLYISKALSLRFDTTTHSAPSCHTEECTPLTCGDVLDEYLMTLSPKIELTQNSQSLIVGFFHPEPQDGVTLSLAVTIYLLDLKLNYKKEYLNRYNTKDDTALKLIVEFFDFTGCNYILTYNGFTYYQCLIQLDYENECLVL